MKFTPYEYQKRAIKKIMTQPSVGLFLEMGLGKSVITLTAIKRLIYDELDVTRVLVIAPLMVAKDTWSRECDKWDHLKDLRVAKVLGSAAKRKAAIAEDADIYVINRENVVWLVDNYRGMWKWDMLVVDELTSFKNPAAARFRALKKVRPKFRRIVGLTGSPDPNGLMDLWAEIFVLDGGERLERTVTRFRQLYFRPGKSNGHVVYDWTPVEGLRRRSRTRSATSRSQCSRRTISSCRIGSTGMSGSRSPTRSGRSTKSSSANISSS